MNPENLDHTGQASWKARREQIIKGEERPGGNNHATATLDDLEESPREAFDEIILPGRASNSGSRMHVPRADRGTEPLCHKSGHGMKRKPIAVYPPGHKEWCKYCLGKWEGYDD